MRWHLALPLATLAVLTLLLVFGDDALLPGRAFQAFWNLGHAVYFAFITWLLLHWPWLKRQPCWLQWAVPLAVTLLIGGTIELLQIGTERTADVMDMLRNLGGSLLVLGLLPVLPSERKAWRWPLRLAALALLLYLLLPFIQVLYDDAMARRQFPVLADFAAPLELSRWQGNADYRLARPPNSDEPALAITLKPGVAYPGVSLKHFPGDWRGYRELRVRLYLQGSEPLSLTLRIHDRAHETGPRAFEYSDRFNRSFRLQPGWNELTVPLEDIRKAPTRRAMDLSQLVDLSLFVTRLKQTRILYLQRIELLSDQ